MRNSLEKYKRRSTSGNFDLAIFRHFEAHQLILKNRKKSLYKVKDFQSKRWMAFSDDVFSPCRNNLEGAAQHWRSFLRQLSSASTLSVSKASRKFH